MFRSGALRYRSGEEPVAFAVILQAGAYGYEICVGGTAGGRSDDLDTPTDVIDGLKSAASRTWDIGVIVHVIVNVAWVRRDVLGEIDGVSGRVQTGTSRQGIDRI